VHKINRPAKHGVIASKTQFSKGGLPLAGAFFSTLSNSVQCFKTIVLMHSIASFGGLVLLCELTSSGGCDYVQRLSIDAGRLRFGIVKNRHGCEHFCRPAENADCMARPSRWRVSGQVPLWNHPGRRRLSGPAGVFVGFVPDPRECPGQAGVAYRPGAGGRGRNRSLGFCGRVVCGGPASMPTV
jgi:hypothetical protein